MTGTARTFGAITITNALPTGIGCAVGVELPVDASVEISREPGQTGTTLRIPPSARSRLVEESLRAGVAEFLADPRVDVSLSLRSEIPVARGLKSSSAVSTAVLLALARAAGREPSTVEVGLLAAEVGRRAEVSATGALDDALAGLEPGFFVTDNLHGGVLRRTEVDPDWGVVLYVPRLSHPPSPTVRSAFTAERTAGERAARAALDGDWATAMLLNTEIVERTMGYPYGELREHLARHGALASGVSGLGPALAVIAPNDRLAELARELPVDDADRRVVPFRKANPRTKEGA